MSVAKEILESDRYKSEHWFRPSQMAKDLGRSRSDIRSSCVALQERGAMDYNDGSFRKKSTERHPIHRRRLANPVKGVNA